jgi:excisionase family DNA binding protein
MTVLGGMGQQEHSPVVLDEQRYYNISQTAALLGVSRVTVSRWIRDGRLPVLRLGHRTTRIARSDLMRVLDNLDSTGGRPPRVSLTNPRPRKRSGSGRVVRPATRESEHAVQFYETDDVLLNAVADFLAIALRAGDAAISIATPEHRAGLDARLASHGIDVAGAIAEGRFLSLDALETLAQFMVDGVPDPVRFNDVIGPIVDRAAAGGRQVRAFGEMVNILAVDGNPAAALYLEELWNELQSRKPFALLCGYQIDRLGGAAFGETIDHVCAVHTRVLPAESYSGLLDSDDRDRAVAVLQQRARWLEAEIADRGRTEERLREALAAEHAARAATEAALRVRDEFLAIAAHELRTPVSGLLLQAQFMLKRFRRDGQLQPDQIAPSLEAINRQSIKLSSFIDRLLDFSRLEAGKLALERKPTDLVGLASQVVQGARALGDRHTITLTAPSSLDGVVDALRLEQVLSNLISNAIKYSPDGGEIEIVIHLPEPGVAVLAVRDHGFGIPPEKRDRIFEPFYQAHGESTQGLGIGLYVSRQIVELHGGDIRAEFPADGGTRMEIRLPIGCEDESSRQTAG